jgi:hypothetical protein
MDLAEYFDQADGLGVLATCDPDRAVDVAVYSKPVVIDTQTIALVMKQRISHQNLRKNLHAAYLFHEKGPGYKGVRLYLTMLREEKNQSLIAGLRKKQPCMYPAEDDSEKFLVFFRVEKTLALVGNQPAEVEQEAIGG